MDLLNNIKKIRLAKGYSQEYMANKLNIATVNYGKIERGITQMTIDKLQSISEILETDIVLLFSESLSISENSVGFVRVSPNKEKESKFSILVNLVQSELSQASLLTELSSNEKLSEKERLTYRIQKENIQDGLFNTFKIFKEQGIIDNKDIKKLVETNPGFSMWQNFVAPLKKLID